MRRRLIAAAPALLAAGWVLILFRSLLAPGAVLAVRDIPFFHLPLRSVFARLAGEGLPVWNPMIHGGQPILSNPNYAAFYPPTWLALALPPALGLSALVLAHAGFACWGAWRLARRLGCDRAPAALAALGFVGGGVFVSSPNTLNLFCGLAWLPWILAWGDRALRDGGVSARRAGVHAAGGLAAQLLAGEPVMVVVSALALGLLALAAPGARRPRGWRLPAILALAAGLGAVQLVPTLARLAETPRAGGLAAAAATQWSTPPERLVEWVFPRFFGDPMLQHRGLYFGFGVHDGDFPYLISIYAGHFLLLLAIAALLRWPIPHRALWAGLLVAGIALALGRHDPLYAGLIGRLPPFSLIRYPEKFLTLAHTGLVFAGALGWQHLLDRRHRGRAETADFPLALGALVVIVGTLLLAVLVVRPELGAWFVKTRSALPRGEEELAAAYRYLGGEALVTCLWAAAAAGLVLLHRLRRTPRVLLCALVLGAVGADLWYHSRLLHPTVRAVDLLEPPPAARALAGAGHRVFSDHAFHAGRTDITFKSATSPLPPWLHNGLHRLEPYSGNLWGLEYALNEDYDVMLTRWGRHALARAYQARRLASDGAPEIFALLGAWNVGTLVLRRPLEEVAEEWLATRSDPPLVRLQANPRLLPRLRFVHEVSFHPDLERAVAAAQGRGDELGERDVCVGDGEETGSRSYSRRARITAARDTGGRLDLRYRSADAAFLVAATTYDRGWRARVDGAAVTPCPTALGQIGLELPAGEHRLVLSYLDPLLPWSALLTLLSAAGAIAVAVGRRR